MTTPVLPETPARLATLAALIGDAARARMLSHLLSGCHATAGELARAACVAPSTASAHLARLRREGLIVSQQRGRHRYFRLADADVAHLLETLSLVADRRSHDRQWSQPARARLREARRCYGHLAGRVGVALLDRMLARRWLVAGGERFELTDGGAAWLASLGLEARPLLRGRYAYPCLDWSERRDHVAGPLAHAMLAHFMERRWLVSPRRHASDDAANRALLLTAAGRRVLLPST
jgi:DNA-binding transcriptional ArsR family regulator